MLTFCCVNLNVFTSIQCHDIRTVLSVKICNFWSQEHDKQWTDIQTGKKPHNKVFRDGHTSHAFCFVVLLNNAEILQTTLCLKKTGPLLHFQITSTILFQYQQILVQRIVN